MYLLILWTSHTVNRFRFDTFSLCYGYDIERLNANRGQGCIRLRRHQWLLFHCGINENYYFRRFETIQTKPNQTEQHKPNIRHMLYMHKQYFTLLMYAHVHLCIDAYHQFGLNKFQVQIQILIKDRKWK